MFKNLGKIKYKVKTNKVKIKIKDVKIGINYIKDFIIYKNAEKTLISGKSLLANGIKSNSDNFDRGEIINILSIDNNILGYGIIAYDAKEIKKIQGKQSKDIGKLLGYKVKDVAINRNDIVLNQERRK